MNWPYAILTDSGGFQVMSLAALRKISEEGVAFRSHLDGSRHLLTPERSSRSAPARRRHHDGVRRCTPFPAEREQVETSMELSMRWAERSRPLYPASRPRDFRHRTGWRTYRSAAPLGGAYVQIGFAGNAIGGLAIGEGQATTFAMVEATVPCLPADRPRYLMGVGKPANIVGRQARGRYVRLRAADPAPAAPVRLSPGPAR